MKTILAFHILSGTIALITGPLAISFKHGGKLHRIFGKIFFVAMLLVAATATILGLVHKNYFLFIVAVFSAYLVSSGYRILYLKKIMQGQKPGWIDYFISGTMFLFAVAFWIWGIDLLLDGNSFSIVFMLFGTISLTLSLLDMKLYAGKNLKKNYWLHNHITKMIAGNIAAFTAFMVVNINFQPNFIVWIAPSLIGGFVIRYYQKKYRQKLSTGNTVDSILELKK